MRKIVTEEEKREKDTRNKVILGLILVVIMVFSTAGYAFFSGEREETAEKTEYNGVGFIKTQGYWVFEMQGITFYTQYDPNETKNISPTIFVSPATYSGKTLYFMGDAPSRREIEINFLGKLVARSQDGCIEGHEDKCNNNTPIKNCSFDNIIILEESEEIKITQNENCITISAPYSEQTLAADAFIFKVLGIQ